MFTWEQNEIPNQGVVSNFQGLTYEIGPNPWGNFRLETAFVRYKFDEDWAIKGGQFKDPFAHESMVSSTKCFSALRSLCSSRRSLDEVPFNSW